MQYSNEAILEGIRLRSKVILEYVYEECYPLISSLVLKNSGVAEDVQDILQDAMVILFRKVKNEDLELKCSFKTFLFSICSHLWLQRLEKRQRETRYFRSVAERVDLSEDVLIEIYDTEAEKYRIYQKHYLSLDEECQNLLRISLKNLSSREIADVMGYKTEKYAKVKKFRCKEELKTRIINDPAYKNLF